MYVDISRYIKFMDMVYIYIDICKYMNICINRYVYEYIYELIYIYIYIYIHEHI